MSPPQWLDRVRRTLRRSGLPGEYVGRLVAELRDHVEDAGDASSLGDPDEVAAAAVANYRAGRLAGRFPLLATVLFPFVAAVAAWEWYIELGIAFVTRIGGTRDPLSLGVAWVLVHLSRFAVPLLAVTVVWRIHRTSGRPVGWYVGGVAGVAALAALYWIEFVPPSVAGEPELTVEFRLIGSGSWWPFVQFGAAVAVAACLPRFGRPNPVRD